MVVTQDLPPQGGYAPINYKRIPIKPMFSGISMFIGYLVFTFGAANLTYLSYKSMHRKKLERISGQIAIQPILMAEREREYLKQLRKNMHEEEQLMAGIEGWEVGKYEGESRFKTVSPDTWIPAQAQSYFVHSPQEDLQYPFYHLFV